MKYLLGRIFFYLLAFSALFDKSSSGNEVFVTVLISIIGVAVLFNMEIKSYE